MCGERALRHLALIWGSNRFRQRQHLRTGFITPQMPCQDLCLALKAPGIERLGSLACFKIDADREDGCHKREHSALHNYMIGGGPSITSCTSGGKEIQRPCAAFESRWAH
jgi:hypothetical protein